jgi:DNA-directed RNA polymerase specialized sigma24 family protein
MNPKSPAKSAPTPESQTSSTYSAEMVAPAIADLTETQIKNLVDQGHFGTWLERKILQEGDPESLAPDSEEASERAGQAGDSEYRATQLLATLTEEQQESLVDQVFGEIGNEAKAEIMDLMPV